MRLLFVVCMALQLEFSVSDDLFNGAKDDFDRTIPLFQYYDSKNFNHYYSTTFIKGKEDEFINMVSNLIKPSELSFTVTCGGPIWVYYYYNETTHDNVLYPSTIQLSPPIYNYNLLGYGLKNPNGCNAGRPIFIFQHNPTTNESIINTDTYTRTEPYSTILANPLGKVDGDSILDIRNFCWMSW